MYPWIRQQTDCTVVITQLFVASIANTLEWPNPEEQEPSYATNPTEFKIWAFKLAELKFNFWKKRSLRIVHSGRYSKYASATFICEQLNGEIIESRPALPLYRAQDSIDNKRSESSRCSGSTYGLWKKWLDYFWVQIGCLEHLAKKSRQTT